MPNPEKDDFLYMAHIREAAARAIPYVQGRDRDFFDANPLLQDAVVHRLQVIGEAANKGLYPSGNRIRRCPGPRLSACGTGLCMIT